MIALQQGDRAAQLVLARDLVRRGGPCARLTTRRAEAATQAEPAEADEQNRAALTPAPVDPHGRDDSAAALASRRRWRPRRGLRGRARSPTGLTR